MQEKNENKKKVLVSGIQASGRLHIGNYFGAMRQNIDLANNGEFVSYIFIADYHALTTLKDGKAVSKYTFDLACAYMACGLDISKTILFKQSDVREHAELSWILSTITPMPMLELAHSYKDKINDEEKRYEINTGLFTYPVLMAADILMYNADVVPVGKDQEQHVEMTREIAGKYNRAWSDTFKMPQEYIKSEVAIVPGVDGGKMSKSKGNVIPLFGTDTEIRSAVMSIVTDSARPEDKKDPDTNNIYSIHKLFLSKAEDSVLRDRFINGGYSYKDAKEALATSIIDFILPMRESYEHYQSHPDEVYEILRVGGEMARAVARETMARVRHDTGLDR